MRIRIGLWIDHRKAIILAVTDQGEEIHMIISKAERPLVCVRDSSLKRFYESQRVPVDENVQEMSVTSLNVFYDTVIACIHAADSILIFGPDEAKGELKKRLEKADLTGRIMGIEAVDKMTDYQITAKIRQHFRKTAISH